MIIRLLLPELLPGFLLVEEAGFLLQIRQEPKQVAASREAFREKVQVIGHNAVSMNRQGIGQRILAKVIQKPLSAGRIEKNSFSPVATESNEEPSHADVTIQRQTDVLVSERSFHT